MTEREYIDKLENEIRIVYKVISTISCHGNYVENATYIEGYLHGLGRWKGSQPLNGIRETMGYKDAQEDIKWIGISL